MAIESKVLNEIATFIQSGLSTLYADTNIEKIKNFLVYSSDQFSDYYTNIEYDSDNNLIGYCLGVFQQGLFDNTGHGILLEMYIVPEKRNVELAATMGEAFELWAIKRGAKKLSTITNPIYQKYLTSRGYTSNMVLFEKTITGTTNN